MCSGEISEPSIKSTILTKIAWYSLGFIINQKRLFKIFRETQRKVDLRWHSNGTVSYKRVKHWFFEKEMSVGALSDVVTTINVPVVGSAEFGRGMYKFNSIVCLALPKVDICMSNTVTSFKAASS